MNDNVSPSQSCSFEGTEKETFGSKEMLLQNIWSLYFTVVRKVVSRVLSYMFFFLKGTILME